MRTFLLAALVAVAGGGLAPAAHAQADSTLLRRALRLHRESPLVDMHNDHPWERRNQGFLNDSDGAMRRALPPYVEDAHGRVTGYHTDIPRLRAGGVGAQFWSIWTPDSMVRVGPARFSLMQIDVVRRMEAAYPDVFAPARTADDIVRAHRAGRIASLMGIEGGDGIENSLELLRQFHELGVRYMTLTWNRDLAWVDAASGTRSHNGLTPFGREVVREMNRLGMLVDLSHVSDSVMAQALRLSEAPVIFSHSSARALAEHRRNVPDAILRMVPRNGGVVAVNFYCDFVDSARVRWNRERAGLMPQWRARFGADTAALRAAAVAWAQANPQPRPSLSVIADHIDHMRRVAGIDHVGLGSDYDGIDCAPIGLEDVSTFPRLTAELLRRGYSDEDVKKVLGLNILRAMRQAEAVAQRLQRQRQPSTATLAIDSAGAR
jgi:membrane dipeptidase